MKSAPSSSDSSSPFPGASTAPAGRLGRVLLGLLLGAITFALVCVILHRALPVGSVPVVSPKLAYFLAHKDEYDAIFIGSSRVVHGVSPEVFDATLGSLGVPCRSFNLGVERMFPPESFQMLQAALKSRPARLKWVFLEMTPIFVDDVEPTLRSITWHDGFGTKSVLQELFTRNGARQMFTRYGSQLIGNLKLWAMNAANVGRVPALLHPEPDEAKAATELAGYMPLHGTHFENEAKAQKFRDAMRDMNQPPVVLREVASVRAFLVELGQIRARGAEPLLFVPPVPQVSVDFLSPALEKQSPKTPVLCYNDTARYAPLFQLDHRYDGAHLNDVGARAFSVLLARDFAETLPPPAKPRP